MFIIIQMFLQMIESLIKFSKKLRFHKCQNINIRYDWLCDIISIDSL